jgi:hypothetical protein
LGGGKGLEALTVFWQKKKTGYYYGLCKATLVKLPQRAAFISTIPSQFDNETRKSHRDMFWEMISEVKTPNSFH